MSNEIDSTNITTNNTESILKQLLDQSAKLVGNNNSQTTSSQGKTPAY